MRLYDINSLCVGTLDKNTQKGQNGLKALENAQYFYKDFSEGNYAVINVEGYDCIAHRKHLTDLLDEIIFPYDKNHIYPVQGLELKYNFKIYLKSEGE